jgi:CheY-like chemotaxis protein
MIIADVLMPIMDGFSLCRQWRRDVHLKEIPFVFYSATYTDPQNQEFGLSLGTDGVRAFWLSSADGARWGGDAGDV